MWRTSLLTGIFEGDQNISSSTCCNTMVTLKETDIARSHYIDPTYHTNHSSTFLAPHLYKSIPCTSCRFEKYKQGLAIFMLSCIRTTGSTQGVSVAMTGRQSLFDTPFDLLPNPKQVWVGEPDSKEEGLGKLSILTPEVVTKAAATEIKTGLRVTMAWELTKLDYPNLNRQPCHHRIVPLLGGVAFDDVHTMNPRETKIKPPFSSMMLIFRRTK